MRHADPNPGGRGTPAHSPSPGDAQVVLIGDGSHGTYEFYAHRANLTQRLIQHKGFNALALEADWPDAVRINR